MRRFIFMTLLLFCCQAFAANCPSATLVKNVELISGVQDKHDSTSWNFYSIPYFYNGKQWQTEFWSFVSSVKNQSDALTKAQAIFNEARIHISEPNGYRLPSGDIFCDYSGNGGAYGIYATSNY